MLKYGVKFSYNDEPETFFYIDSDEAGLNVSTEFGDEGQDIWEIDAGLPREISKWICDYVLEGKIKFANLPELEDRPVHWAPPQMRAYILYLIDKDNTGRWIVRGLAYDTEGKREGQYGQTVVRDFDLSDEKFYYLLARAKEEVE
jgi:hypothetical protein